MHEKEAGKIGRIDYKTIQTHNNHIYNKQEMSRLNGDSQGYARLFYKIKKDRATCMHYDVVFGSWRWTVTRAS